MADSRTRSGQLPALAAVVMKPVPSALVNTSQVAGLSGGIGQQARGFHNAGDGQAILDFGISHRVATDDDSAGGDHAFRTPSQDPLEHRQFQLLVGKAHEVQRGYRPSARGIRIAQGIGGGDLSEHERIIHQRRKEVDRLHDVQVIAQPIDSRVTEESAPTIRFGSVNFGNPRTTCAVSH